MLEKGGNKYRAGLAAVLLVGAVTATWLALSLTLSPQASAAAPQSASVAVVLPSDPDFEIHDQRLPWTNERHPDVAYNLDKDEYMVVFDWDFDGSAKRDIMAITVTVEGVVGHNPIPITTDSSHDDTHPAIAYNPDSGKYLVVWQRWHSASASQIVGSMVGDTAGAEITLRTSLHGNLQYPDVAYSPGAGRFLVVWETYEPYTLPPDIYGATLNGSGGNIQAIHISPYSTNPGQQRYPAVANNHATGRWLVTWQDTRNGGTTGRDIYGQQVQYSGGSVSLWSGVVPIGTIAAEAGAPAVDWGPVGGGDGEFLTVWTEGTSNAYARRIQADNTLVGDPIIVSNTESDKANAAVAYASDSNDWWVVWESG